MIFLFFSPGFSISFFWEQLQISQDYHNHPLPKKFFVIIYPSIVGKTFGQFLICLTFAASGICKSYRTQER